MKFFKYIFSFLSLVVFCMTVDASAYWHQADSAYNARNYPEAIELYKQSIAQEGTSSRLLYNLGNAYYRDNNLGQAILSYERALRLDPSNVDARRNLEFVNGKILDRTRPQSKGGEGQSTVERYLSRTIDTENKVLSSTHPNTLAWLTVAAFALTVCLIAFYIYSNKVLIKKVAFYSASILLIVSIAGIFFSIRSAKNASRHDQAVITSESTMLSTSPARPLNASEEAVLLHEGTKITILDSVATPNDPEIKKWFEVQIDGLSSAWVADSDIEFI